MAVLNEKARAKATVAMDGGRDLVEWVERLVSKQPENIQAKVQYGMLFSLVKVAQERGFYDAIPTLGSIIMRDQYAKMERWGEKAFILSRKQVEAVIRDVENFRGE